MICINNVRHASVGITSNLGFITERIPYFTLFQHWLRIIFSGLLRLSQLVHLFPPPFAGFLSFAHKIQILYLCQLFLQTLNPQPVFPFLWRRRRVRVFLVRVVLLENNDRI